MSDDFHTEINGIKVNINLSIPETLHAVKDLIPHTLNAADQVGKSIISLLGFPLLYGEKYTSYVLESTKRKLKNRLEKIPTEHLHQAFPRMLIPLLQEIYISADQDLLQDMFIQLLASSMDSAKDEFIHPAFISIIKNLSPLEAKILKESIKVKNTQFPAYEIRLQVPGGKIISPEYPSFFHHLTAGCSFHQHIINFSSLINTNDLSALLQEIDMITDNLIRQGIIDTNQGNTYLVNPSNYKDDLPFLYRINQHFYTLSLREPNYHGTEVTIIPHTANKTTLGNHFISCCVP